MASKKVPKLVIKPRHSTRRLKVPSEIEESEQEGRASRRSKSLSRATRVIKKAKTSVRTHSILIAIGLCAALAVYGVGATLTAEEGESADTDSDKPDGKNSEKEVVNIVWEDVPNSPGIKKKITVTTAGIDIKFFREEKVPGGRRLIPWTPPKPKPELSSDEKEKRLQQQQGQGLTIQ
jgi:hypothetical protein